MKTFFESVGSVPVERDRKAASVEALHGLGRIASEGHGVGIYPEHPQPGRPAIAKWN